MPLYFSVPAQGGEFDIEITDDGALVFLDYDIEADVIAAELGDEESVPFKLLRNWQESPTLVLLRLYSSSNNASRYTIAKIGDQWLFDALDLLSDSVCEYNLIIRSSDKARYQYSAEYVDTIKKSVRTANYKPIRDYRGDQHANMSNAARQIINYKIGTETAEYTKDGLRQINYNHILNARSEIARALAWCKVGDERFTEYLNNMLITAIRIIRESWYGPDI